MAKVVGIESIIIGSSDKPDMCGVLQISLENGLVTQIHMSEESVLSTIAALRRTLDPSGYLRMTSLAIYIATTCHAALQAVRRPSADSPNAARSRFTSASDRSRIAGVALVIEIQATNSPAATPRPKAAMPFSPEPPADPRARIIKSASDKEAISNRE